ncbi:MAG: oxygenase MpaB family protein [Nocardioidaceae bacterium]
MGWTIRSRGHWLREISRLDPDMEYERIAYLTAKHEFPWDIQQALSFALFRTYAVPSIGRLLYDTGEFTERTQKRHDDTALILDEVSEHGLESVGGRRAVRRMNQMHGGYDISNDDLRYVLATFVVTPVRWIEAYGWRRLVDAEVRAATAYYRRLGRLMGIRDLPETYDGFATLLDAYEAEHFAYDEGARRVADATLALLGTFYPRPLRPLVRLFSLSIMDEPLRRAFGYDAPQDAVVRLSRRLLWLRGRLERWLPARSKPKQVKDLRIIRSYPGGFDPERLGTFPTAPTICRRVAANSPSQPPLADESWRG